MKEWLLEFAKTPTGAIICGGAMVIVIAVVILANTSIGKKSLIKLTSLIESAKVQSATTKSTVELNSKKVEEEIEKFKAECEKRAEIAIQHTQELEELIVSVSKSINNKKIKELITAYLKNKTEQNTNESENDAL